MDRNSTTLRDIVGHEVPRETTVGMTVERLVSIIRGIHGADRQAVCEWCGERTSDTRLYFLSHAPNQDEAALMWLSPCCARKRYVEARSMGRDSVMVQVIPPPAPAFSDELSS